MKLSKGQVKVNSIFYCHILLIITTLKMHFFGSETLDWILPIGKTVILTSHTHKFSMIAFVLNYVT